MQACAEHLYWAGVDSGSEHRNNNAALRLGQETYHAGISQIQLMARCPQEMRRGQQALHYPYMLWPRWCIWRSLRRTMGSSYEAICHQKRRIFLCPRAGRQQLLRETGIAQDTPNGPLPQQSTGRNLSRAIFNTTCNGSGSVHLTCIWAACHLQSSQGWETNARETSWYCNDAATRNRSQ